MKGSSSLERTKQFRSRATGTLLLALPLWGIAFQLPTAQAQSGLNPPAKKNHTPLAPKEKAAIDQILTIARQERVCKTLVDLKVENASLVDVVSRIREMLPVGTLPIDVRTKRSLQVSFDLKQVRVGDLLSNVAGLAGSKLFVLPKGLTIADTSQLTAPELTGVKQNEGGEWSQSSEAGGSSWSNMAGGNSLLTHAIAQEVLGTVDGDLAAGTVNATFGDFSPESQAMLQELVAWLNARTPNATVDLKPASAVVVQSSDPTRLKISFPPDSSNPGARTRSIQNILSVNPG